MVDLVTAPPANFPDLQDPATFDAYMTSWGSWFDQVVPELNVSFGQLNTALNDNGTVLDATADAVARSTNANTPIDTTGTDTAYTIAPAVAISAYADGQAFLVRPHQVNGMSATLDAGPGALPIQIRDETNTLAPVSAGLLGQFEEFVMTVAGGATYFEVTSLPVKFITDQIAIKPKAYEELSIDLVAGTNSEPGVGAETATGNITATMIRVGRLATLSVKVWLPFWYNDVLGTDTFVLKSPVGAQNPLPAYSNWRSENGGALVPYGPVFGRTYFQAPAGTYAQFVCNSPTDNPYILINAPSSTGSNPALTFNDINPPDNGARFDFTISFMIDPVLHPDIENP